MKAENAEFVALCSIWFKNEICVGSLWFGFSDLVFSLAAFLDDFDMFSTIHLVQIALIVCFIKFRQDNNHISYEMRFLLAFSLY
jgi:hypothetical protein